MKRDLKKELKTLYKTSLKEVTVVDVPAMNFLMIDGEGNPNTSEYYKSCVETLFAMSYGIKFAVKKGELAIDYGVMPLEGLWWADDMSAFSTATKDNWKWRMMIMQPGFIGTELVDEIRENVKVKKDLTLASEVRFESYCEGTVAQIMHLGPFSEEGPTIEKVHGFIDDNGMKRSGLHHEIYLSDIRRAAPEKWKTIIRQPCRKYL